jgi:anion-transporting  ArsA/GET3 family ATPase
MSNLFVWGAGGVGKTHMAIRRAALSKPSTLLITLDPSFRVYDLMRVPRDRLQAEVQLPSFAFTLKRTDQAGLFNALSAERPAHPKVRLLYDQMVKGLQDFRDYLTLIQLSDELRDSKFQTIVIDTPPFQEAMGLHRSLFNLRHFFEKSLVQLALKTSNLSWFHSGLKKIFEVTRIFSGKRAADQIFEFIEWLTFHTDRFSLSARYLEELVYSKDTEHLFVLTPETPPRFLESVRSFFEKSSRLQFTINRSVSKWTLTDQNDDFVREIRSRASQEAELFSLLQKKFRSSPVERIPLMSMGEDTDEELLEFIREKSIV